MSKQLNQKFSRTNYNFKTSVQRALKAAPMFGFLVFLICICSSAESKAKSPEYDPWYYVRHNEYEFVVPDKFQHFYGSAILTEMVGPMPALAFGVLKEIHDDTDGLVGFSMKDITADVLGIMSARFAQTEKVTLWLDWDPGEETLVLNFGIRL